MLQQLPFINSSLAFLDTGYLVFKTLIIITSNSFLVKRHYKNVSNAVNNDRQKLSIVKNCVGSFHFSKLLHVGTSIRLRDPLRIICSDTNTL